MGMNSHIRCRASYACTRTSDHGRAALAVRRPGHVMGRSHPPIGSLIGAKFSHLGDFVPIPDTTTCDHRGCAADEREKACAAPAPGTAALPAHWRGWRGWRCVPGGLVLQAWMPRSCRLSCMNAASTRMIWYGRCQSDVNPLALTRERPSRPPSQMAESPADVRVTLSCFGTAPAVMPCWDVLSPTSRQTLPGPWPVRE
jgi:hypothetical protein